MAFELPDISSLATKFSDSVSSNVNLDSIQKALKSGACGASDALDEVKGFADDIKAKLAEGKDEAYVYAYHHDGPSLKYGGLKISKNKVMPLVDKFEKYLKRKGELQDIDFPETDNNRTSSPRPRLRDDE